MYSTNIIQLARNMNKLLRPNVEKLIYNSIDREFGRFI